MRWASGWICTPAASELVLSVRTGEKLFEPKKKPPMPVYVTAISADAKEFIPSPAVSSS